MPQLGLLRPRCLAPPAAVLLLRSACKQCVLMRMDELRVFDLLAQQYLPFCMHETAGHHTFAEAGGSCVPGWSSVFQQRLCRCLRSPLLYRAWRTG